MSILLSINTADSRSIYQQVADGIKELIARGELAEGASLPPVRQLAADLGVNMNTIATAYRELQKDGLVVIKHGSGCTVGSRIISQRSEEELSRPLRAALTEFVLSGVSTTKIIDTVVRQLSLVAKESP
jgi:GntR family transcriptional regulator